MKNFLAAVTLSLVLLLSLGCVAPSQDEGTGADEPAVTTTPSPTPSPAPTPMPTPAPSPAPSPDETITPTTTPDDQAADSTVGVEEEVTIQNFAYAPPSLTIPVGTTVIWTNFDSAPHTVTSESGDELDSPVLSTGETFSHTFTTPGVFPYYCTIHPSMRASVTVQ